MTKTMRQIVMTGPRQSRVIEVPVPEINDDQVLVRVTYTGMCHSECWPWYTAKAGDVLGHETIGVVARVGRNIRGFREGDRVTGLGGGGYREYIVMEPDKMVHVPDNLADTDAIAEPLACLMSAAGKMMPVLPGDSIAVVGCGYMGLGMISLFRLCGYGEIIAIDKRPEALANAERFGATRLFKADEVDIHYLLNWETMGRVDLTRDGDNGMLFALGVPNVMEFSGTADGLNLAGELVRSHGRLGIGGYHNDELRSVDFKLWNYKAITAINCHERRIDYEAGLCRRCLELLGSGRWNFTGVTNHIYEMEEFDRANEEMLVHRDGFIKGVVRC